VSGKHLHLSPSLASNSISPLKKNIHMRMGDGWVSPDPTAGSLRKSALRCRRKLRNEERSRWRREILANDVDRQGSKRDAPLVLGRNRTKLSGAVIKVPQVHKGEVRQSNSGRHGREHADRVPHRSNGILNARSAQRREPETTGVRSLSSTTFWHRLHCKR